MKQVLKFFKPYWWMLILILITTSVGVWATLQLPMMMASIVDNGIIGQDESYIISEGLKMLGITAIGGVAVVGSGFLAARIGSGFAKEVRAATFAKVNSFSQAEINKFSTASLITRSSNDVQQLQQVTILILRMVLQAPIMAVGAVINALATAPNMTWVMALGVSAFFVLIIALFIAVMPKFKIVQKLVDKLNLVARENLTGLRIIRAFRNEKYEEKKFAAANEDMRRINVWINRAISLMQPMMTLIVNGVLLAIVWVGAHEIASGNLEIGNMMAFMQYALQVIMSFLFLAVLMIFLPRAQVSMARIGEILSTKNSIKEPENPEPFDQNMKGIVEFRDVTFSYPDADAPILSGINFTAQPGQTTAFIGSTGSGKSTLINLIPRFYDVSAGQVLIDGRDVRDVSHEDLVRAIGYVPQKGVLFSGTVESNIKYGAPKISDKEVLKAAEIAQAEFVLDLDGAFKHHIAQGGSNVSGGQKQRLSIARAIAKNPEIFIFDDSFSAVDYKTDAALRHALKPITRDKTVLIVAQRISTIKAAEQIVVLDEGHIVGRGTHQELLLNCKVYREIAQSQFSDIEMEREMAAIRVADRKAAIAKDRAGVNYGQ
ncbi:ABC transporter ATP-binding protein/permease [Candidatus Saccharibacteria bacterium]|nr:ABC transporter ATP-binding protein/permease [Candidatus Saccharibacteria bacterium]